MKGNIGNTFLCMKKGCNYRTAWVQDMDEIEQHPEHKLKKIKTLKDQLNDPQHQLNKFLLINREIVMIDIYKKIQELNDLSKALIIEFGQKMRKFANDTMNLFDHTLFLLNGVRNLDPQIIGNHSKEISELFGLSQEDIEIKMKEAANMSSRENETTETLKEQIRKIFRIINFDEDQQIQQQFKWSEVMKHKDIIINNKNVKSNNTTHHWHTILLEPRIDFNSRQSCRVKFSSNGKCYYIIRLVDYKVLREKNPEFTLNGYGSYKIYNDGDVQYDDNKLPVKSFEFSSNELIEMNWDGPRKVFGIQSIETDKKFKINVEFNENSQLYFGVSIFVKVSCSLE